ncbi:MAG: DEAD/DEAH box helicase, partial [Oscillospiraceae bacterium]
MKDLTFQELNLTPNLQRAIDEMGFIEATSIQSQVIPIIRNGDDVIGRSQTGTGKTIAFAIPAVELILNSETPSTLAQVLVLCPTRELTQQACVEIRKLTKYTPAIKIAEVYGGESMIKQITQLRTANIVVGTPGRIMDHMRRRTLKLNNLHMIILDEADEML